MTGFRLATHQLKWAKELVTGESSTSLKYIAGKNLEILAPRDSGKSHVILVFVAWVIGHNPAIRILYISYGEHVATKKSRIIKRYIEKPEYRECFPHIKKHRNRWSDKDWELDKSWAKVSNTESDFTLYAAGFFGSITSLRSDLIIFDDTIKDLKSIENPRVRRGIVDSLDNAILPTMSSGARAISVGTRFRPDDIHATEFTEDNDWKVITQSAIVLDANGNEKSYWESRNSKEHNLEFFQKLREKKYIPFSYQYQNIIVKTSKVNIHPTWIIRNKVYTNLSCYEQLVIGCDLSPSEKEQTDYTSFILAGRLNGFFYIIDAVQGRWGGNVSKLDKLLEICEEWGIVKDSGKVDEYNRKLFVSTEITTYFCPESEQYQSSLVHDFQRIIIQEQMIYNIICHPVKTHGRDKLSRLRQISGMFESGRIIFNEYRPMGIVIQQLLNFGAEEHDDYVDALVYTLIQLDLLGGHLSAA